jgi:hypothetical protein
VKRLSLLILAIIIIACGEAAKTEDSVRARDAAMDAATSKMIVTQGNDLPSHSPYVTLGKVRGHCLENPEANDIIATGDDLRQAAYRKFGGRVDAIVDAGAFHINDDYTPEAPPGSDVGHFECEGIAVHFADGK